METEKNETEQVYEELTKANEETTEEPSEKPDEVTEQPEEPEEDEILSEEELEVEREIESYATKSEELDAKLAKFRANKVDEMKRDKMREWNYTDEQIDRYIRHIDGETAEEIASSVLRLAEEIPNPQDNYHDPSLLNGQKQKPKTADPGEIGKKAFERVKHKVFPFFGRR